MVTTAPQRHGSAAAAIAGVAGGYLLGAVIAGGVLANTHCYNSCGGVELAMAGALIGIPIAAGYGAWRASSRMIEDVIYRRIQSARP